MIENIDNVLLKDMFGDLIENTDFVISESLLEDPPSDNLVRVMLPIEGEGKDLELVMSREEALTLGEIITTEKIKEVDEKITMTLSVILKKMGDVLSYFSEYTFGEPYIAEEPPVGERKYYMLTITSTGPSCNFFISEPTAYVQSHTGDDAMEELDNVVEDIDFGSAEQKQEIAMPKQPGQWDLVMDIPVEIIVELGKTRLTIQEVLNLTLGSVVELNKLSGESVDVLANGKPFAEGEVVVIGDNFGVRLTQIKESIYSQSFKKAA